MLTARFQVAYLVATFTIFVAVAALTRARARRIAGAVASVLVFTTLSAPMDELAARLGWWTYPSSPPHPPLPVYLGQAFVFVGNVALIGWRVQRRFGARGVAWLAMLVCVVGAIRDFVVAAVWHELITFGPQPQALAADVAAWGVVVLVALTVTRLVAGQARADALRGAPPS